MKKVLFICPTGTLRSGGELSNYQLIKYLKKKGYTVEVFTSWRGDYNDTLRKGGIKNFVGHYNWWTDWDQPADIAPGAMGAVAAIYSEIERFDPDVVITNTLHVPWGALAAAMANKPHVWIAREFTCGNFAYLHKKMDFIRAYSNQIMANSEELALFLRRGYDASVGHFYSYVDATPLKLNSEIGDTRLVSPNYLNSRKNQKELIEAVALLKRQDPNFSTKIVFIGGRDEEYWRELKKVITSSNLESLVEFRGHTPNPWSLVGPNDILVQTSLSESIGRTTTEAMKLGIPVIASDIPGHREAFRLGGGVMYDSGSSADLASKIRYALSNLLNLQKEAEKTRLKVLETMSEDSCNSPFVRALEGVRGQDNPQGALRFISPYYEQYVKHNQKEMRRRDRDITKLSTDVSLLTEVIEDIKSSRAYRLGRAQTGVAKKVINLPNMVFRRSKR